MSKEVVVWHFGKDKEIKGEDKRGKTIHWTTIHKGIVI